MPRTSARTDPRLIRQVLTHVEAHGPYVTAQHFDLFASTVYRWQQYRAERGPQWPTDADIETWDAEAGKRASNSRRWRRNAHRQHFRTGPALIDSTGTGRRLRALVALGHSQSALGAVLHLTGARISQLCRDKNPLVFRETAEKIQAIYNQLSMAPPPTGRGPSITRGYARNQGWPSPLAWDDDTIDDPNAQPDVAPEPDPDAADYIDDAAVLARIEGNRTVELNAAEQLELVHRMTAAEWGQKQIEAQTGINAARVLREERARLAAAQQDHEAAA